MNTPTAARLLRTSALALSLVAAVAQADPKARAEFDNQLASVKALSAALAREQAPEARATLTTVAARQKEAEDLASVGEFGAAKQILDEGYRTLTRTLAAVKSGTGYGGPTGSAAASAKAGAAAGPFDSRLASAKALLDTLTRLNADSGHKRDATVAEVEGKLKQAEALRAANAANAMGVLDEAYNQIKLTVQQMQAPSTLKSGSAALEANQAASAPGGVDEAERALKSTQLLRDAIVRLGKEKNRDVAQALGRIDQLVAEAQTKRGSDAAGAANAAASANQLAKDTLAGLR